MCVAYRACWFVINFISFLFCLSEVVVTKNMQQVFTVCLALLCSCLFLQYFISLFCFFNFWNFQNKYSTVQAREGCLETHPPKVQIVVTLRGADASLKSCLEGIFSQSYSNFIVNIIIDSPSDSAWEVVRSTVDKEKAKNVFISSLKNVNKTCSLRCDALLQAFESLDESYDFVVDIDADAVVHKTWLEELIRPMMCDPNIFATTGNRWYLPSDSHWGTVARYIWNISAMTQMFLNKIPWGGSVAIRTSVFTKTDFLERLKVSINDDVFLGKILQEEGFCLEFVPSILILNCEECTLQNFWHWSRRQTLWTRLYSPNWPRVILQTLFLETIPPLSPLLLGLYSLIRGEFFWFFTFLFLFLFHLTALIGLISLWEKVFRRVTQNRYCLAHPVLSASLYVRLLLALPLTLLCSASTLVSCMFMRKVSWRQVTYQIDGPYDIKVLKYKPYQYSNQKNQNLSIL